MKISSTSLRFKLLLLLGSMALLVWLSVIVLVYFKVAHEAEELFDANLAIEARVLTALLKHEVDEERENDLKVEQLLTQVSERLLRQDPALVKLLAKMRSKQDEIELGSIWNRAVHEYESKLALVARYTDGKILLNSPGSPDFGPRGDGFFNAEAKGASWRGFSINDAQTGFYVQVGEQLEIRQELVENVVTNTLLPILIAFPVQLWLVWFGVRHGLRPLVRLAREVELRKAESLEPVVSEGVPQETQPLVKAINRLFGRIRATLENERRFTADAAHELRTPLAALKAHIQVANRSNDPQVIRQSLLRVCEGVDRATHLVDQLLTLARADAQGPSLAAEARADLRSVALDVVSSYSQRALDKGIDLGLEASGAFVVNGDAAYLGILIRNLIDNAIRYSQRGGQVTLRLTHEGERVLLEVLDDGPGVAEEELSRLFDRFHRVGHQQESGSGLGMSIVQRIAELHGAHITLGKGLVNFGFGIGILFTHHTQDR